MEEIRRKKTARKKKKNTYRGKQIIKEARKSEFGYIMSEVRIFFNKKNRFRYFIIKDRYKRIKYYEKYLLQTQLVLKKI